MSEWDFRTVSKNIHIARGSRIHNTCSIGHGSCIGYPSELSVEPVILSAHCSIGCFCVIEKGVVLEDNVSLDHYCRIDALTRVGNNTRIRYGARVHEKVQIGSHCVIAGNCPDRTVIEDYVTHMGRIAHAYKEPFAGWNARVQESPYIESYTVIGANALIIGGVHIGHHTYIAAGEVVKQNVPPKSVVYKGRIYPADEWQGELKELGFFDFNGDTSL